MVVLQKEFEDMLQNNIKKYENLELKDIRLNKMDLSKIIFENVTMENVEFKECNLVLISFNNCIIKQCDFSKSNFDTVELDQCAIFDSKFIDTKIVGDCEQYVCGYTKVEGCNFDKMTVCSCIDFIECSFKQCSFNGAEVRCSSLDTCVFTQSNLKKTKIDCCISTCEFSDIDLMNSEIDGITRFNDFIRCNFKNASLYGEVFLNSKHFNECSLEESNIGLLRSKGEVNLQDYNLCKIRLKYAKWANANIKDCDLMEAYISKGDLSGANLENVNLKSATIEETNLTGANLINANLEDVKFDNVVLDGVRILRKDFHYIKDYIDESKVILED